MTTTGVISCVFQSRSPKGPAGIPLTPRQRRKYPVIEDDAPDKYPFTAVNVRGPSERDQEGTTRKKIGHRDPGQGHDVHGKISADAG